MTMRLVSSYGPSFAGVNRSTGAVRVLSLIFDVDADFDILPFPLIGGRLPAARLRTDWSTSLKKNPHSVFEPASEAALGASAFGVNRAAQSMDDEASGVTLQTS